MAKHLAIYEVKIGSVEVQRFQIDATSARTALARMLREAPELFDDERLTISVRPAFVRPI